MHIHAEEIWYSVRVWVLVYYDSRVCCLSLCKMGILYHFVSPLELLLLLLLFIIIIIIINLVV